jgi:hypothetical protein
LSVQSKLRFLCVLNADILILRFHYQLNKLNVSSVFSILLELRLLSLYRIGE